VSRTASRTGFGQRCESPNAGIGGAIPLTATFDLLAGPDGYLYAAAHGRGIWQTRLSEL
jgi:hypothetical protein